MAQMRQVFQDVDVGSDEAVRAVNVLKGWKWAADTFLGIEHSPVC